MVKAYLCKDCSTVVSCDRVVGTIAIAACLVNNDVVMSRVLIGLNPNETICRQSVGVSDDSATAKVVIV
jgi:hypothetical protein